MFITYRLCCQYSVWFFTRSHRYDLHTVFSDRSCISHMLFIC